MNRVAGYFTTSCKSQAEWIFFWGFLMIRWETQHISSSISTQNSMKFPKYLKISQKS
jgi:hypothetical protein